MSSEAGIETCARLMVGSPPSPLFVKGTWFPLHFLLSISDGLHCWTCQATKEAVADRAAGWDESVSEYLQRTQFWLSHQHPQSTYAFLADGEHGKLSWTMEKHGTKLEGKWKCEKAKNDQQITCSILNFLMDSNVKLSDEVLRKTQSFERMKGEADKCLKQSEQFKNEKQQFETDIFRKFVAVLNSKKSKLRELRDKLAHFEPAKRSGDEETDGNESEGLNSGSDEDDEESSGGKEQAGSDHALKGKHETHTSKDIKPVMRTSKGSPSQDQADVGTSEIQKPIASTSGVVDSTAALLADSTYTSAPKRRRQR